MKSILIVLLFACSAIVCEAQYNKEKLTEILAGSATKVWTVKSGSSAQGEKAFTFSKDLSVTISKTNAIENEKWALSSTDNIRWFITIGSKKYEVIVSYDKAGAQFLKLTSQANDKTSLYYNELLLYPSK